MKLILVICLIGVGIAYGVISLTPDNKVAINADTAKSVASKGIDFVKENVVIVDNNK